MPTSKGHVLPQHKLPWDRVLSNGVRDYLKFRTAKTSLATHTLAYLIQTPRTYPIGCKPVDCDFQTFIEQSFAQTYSEKLGTQIHKI